MTSMSRIPAVGLGQRDKQAVGLGQSDKQADGLGQGDKRARAARDDALRDMMAGGLSPRAVLLGRNGVGPKGLRALRLTARATVSLAPAQADREVTR